MKYVITDGHGSYIRKDDFSRKYVPVRNLCFAEVFDERYKASNVLKNAISKNIRKNYKIEEYLDTGLSKNHIKCEYNKPNKKDDVVKAIAGETVHDSQQEKWSAGVKGIADFISDAEVRKVELVAKLSEVDKEITDIHHYIEFGVFNAYQGWLAFNMLRQRLRRRRKIKDELRVIVELGACKITSDMMIDINNAIVKLGNRKYEPRVLKQLFD